ncbi:[protein-PII] uridylyltransferase [Thiohalorhabdus methylotrophus]|uniref:Bifunctional uridylyltransferase/uridylyl-removing enzyme n=1 Tax=Thiohalorhabdus methylotrophus TaxID=3242694 RepID=A0ABV4TYZ7_9GAMM
MLPGPQPPYRLPHRERIFAERDFPKLVAGLQRLHPPPSGWTGTVKASFLELFRDAYEDGRGFLRQRFEEGATGREIVRGHAYLTDRLLQQLWRLMPDYLEDARRAAPLCILAVGGYGRAELHPHSDIDLLILHDDTAVTAAAFAEPFLHFLWDMGLPVSHALRTPAECVSDAETDVTIRTTMLEARLLAGDRDLFDRFRRDFRKRGRGDPAAFIADKQEEQRQRHQRYGGPVYNLEPNVKESWGGLRDLHLLFWVARHLYDAATLRDLVKQGVLSAAELRSLSRAQEFLWRVRNGLHYLTERNENRLQFDHQRTLAARFGYRDTAATLAVEKFMKRYYRTLRQVVALTNIGLQTLQQTGPAPATRPAGPGMRYRGEYLEATDPLRFQTDPAHILTFFTNLQQLDQMPPLEAGTLRALWSGSRRVDSTVRSDERVQEGIIRLLSVPGRVAGVLRRMNTYGLLGRFIPEFGRIVGQTQHNLYHIYPVDEHTLRAMEMADYFYREDPSVLGESSLACRLARTIRHPEILYLGLLCHDIAKGQGGDHSLLGTRVARRMGRRLGLDPEDAETAAWLVQYHLYLSQTSQKRDIHDPEVIAEVAYRVRTQERLDLLFLLTEADMRATGPKVWNTWKAQLLTDLYFNVRQALRTGVPADTRARARRIRHRIIETLSAEGFGREEVRAHLKRTGQDYLLHYHPEELAQHTRILLNGSGPTIVEVAPHSRAGGTEILLYTPDRAGLFTLATGTLAGLGLNIMEAKVHTTRDHWALDTFIVLDQEDRPVADPRDRERIRGHLYTALTQPAHLPPAPSRQGYRERAQRHFHTPVRVQFYRGSTPEETVAEVIAPDAPGVLYRIARIFSEFGCQIHAAKVATFGERTEDTFELSHQGPPEDRDARRRALAEAIRREFEPETAPS